MAAGDRNQQRKKKSQLFIEFPFIYLSNSKSAERSTIKTVVLQPL